MTIAALLTVLYRQVVGVFFDGYGEEMPFYDLACRSILFMIPACLITGFNIFISGLFTAYSNGTVSMILSTLRTFVLLAAAMFLLSFLAGTDGLWGSWFAAEAIALVVSIFVLRGLSPFNKQVQAEAEQKNK